MKSKDSRQARRWTRATAMMRPTHNATHKAAAVEPQRGTQSDQLGPYEASYDVAMGYGFERPIVTP